MRFEPEPADVIHRVASEVGIENGVARTIVEDIRHIVDRAVADDQSVLLWPLMFRRSGEPVCHAIVERFTDEDWQEGLGLKALSPPELARELGLSPEALDDYPVAFGIHILSDLFEWRGLEPANPAGDLLHDVFYAWRRTYSIVNDDLNRPYRFSHVGLERDFETWLEGNLDVLTKCGYPVELVRRQPRFADGARGDLLFRVTADADPLHAGDWLLVENKATPVGVRVRDQVARYVASVKAEYATGGESVFGLLIADGRTVELQQALTDEGFGYLSLSEIGYRDHIFRQRAYTAEPDVSMGTVAPPRLESA